MPVNKEPITGKMMVEALMRLSFRIIIRPKDCNQGLFLKGRVEKWFKIRLGFQVGSQNLTPIVLLDSI